MRRPILACLSSACFLLPVLGVVDLGGCRADSAPELETELGQSYGGLTADDEEPMFGEANDYQSIGEAEADPAADPTGDSVDETTATDADTAITTVSDDTGGASTPAVYAVRVLWGRRPFDLEATTATTWDPTFTTDCGFLAIRRLIALEGETGDAVVRPRPDAQTVGLTSTTKPSVDGIVLALVIPAAQATCASTGLLHIDSAALSAPIDIALSALGDTELEVPVGDADSMVVTSHQLEKTGDCVRGYVTGRWQAFADADGVRPGLGHFRGRILDLFGELRGHVRGIYGTPKRGLFSGEQIFYGKMIHDDGRFLGLLAGRYGDGQLGGGWLLRPALGGLHGRVHGRYTAASEADADGGFFVGRYASSACARPVAADTLE